ncbi:MAG: hypothetical protein ACYDCL_23925 [Myxococcales bacterium]
MSPAFWLAAAAHAGALFGQTAPSREERPPPAALPLQALPPLAAARLEQGWSNDEADRKRCASGDQEVCVWIEHRHALWEKECRSGDRTACRLLQGRPKSPKQMCLRRPWILCAQGDPLACERLRLEIECRGTDRSACLHRQSSTPDRTDGELILRFRFGGGLLGPSGGWAGSCPGKCGLLWRNLQLPGATLSPPAGTWVAGGGGSIGGARRLWRRLWLQFGFDVWLGLGEAGPAGSEPATSPNYPSLSFRVPPSSGAGLAFVGLPVDLRLDLGASWRVYAGLEPAVGLEQLSATATGPGLSNGSVGGSVTTTWWSALWRAGFDHVFAPEAENSFLLGALAEGELGGRFAVLNLVLGLRSRE